MKHATTCLTAALALLCCTGATAASQPPMSGSARGTLRASAVPVLLPSRLPRALGNVRSIAVISAGHGGYYVGYSALERCGGALACALLHVAGFAGPARLEPLERDRTVRLSDGTRALFRSEDCSGASCTEAALLFTRRGTLYELDAKVAAGDLRVLSDIYRTLRIVR